MTFQSIIRGHVALSAIINADTRVAQDGLVELGCGQFRVNHGQDEFARGPMRINGIEGFWGVAKVRLMTFTGLPEHTVQLHLKETAWRYDMRHADKDQTLLKYLRDKPSQLGKTLPEFRNRVFEFLINELRCVPRPKSMPRLQYFAPCTAARCPQLHG